MSSNHQPECATDETIYTLVGHQDNVNTNIGMLTRFEYLFIHCNNLEYFISISNENCKIIENEIENRNCAHLEDHGK